jgi:sn-glycerol 3-phosphate transport system substrate-binding protein
MSRRASRRSLVVGSLPLAFLSACRSLGGGDRGVSPGGHATFWYSYGGKNREVLEKLIGRFHREQASTWIDATFQGDYFEALAKLRTSIAAKAAPAMSHVVAEVVPYLAEAGVLEPLEGYEGASSLDLLPSLAQSGTYAGGAGRPLVAVPFNRSTPIMYMNGELLDRAGLATPTNWQELRSAANVLTQRRADRTVWGFECPVSWWFWVALVGAAGGKLVDDEGRVTLGGDAGVHALELWQTLVHRDRVMRPPLGRDYNAWQVAMQDFLSGRAAIIWSSTAFMRYVEENARFPVKVAGLPGQARRAVPTGGTFFVLLRGAAAAEKKAAWEFVKWMVLPKQTIEWSNSTGYMPVTRSAVEELRASGYYEEHPNDGVALEQLETVEPWPWSPTLFRVQREIVDPLLEDAVISARSASEALATARREALEP